MKLLRKLAIAMIVSNILVSDIQASELVSINNTFTHKNIQNTVDGNSLASYMITNTGNVMAIGSYIYGIDANGRVDTKIWKPIKKNIMGDNLDNIVKVKNNGMNVLFIDDKGNVYQSGIVTDMNTFELKSIYIPEKIDGVGNVVSADSLTINAGYGNTITTVLNDSGENFLWSNAGYTRVKLDTDKIINSIIIDTSRALLLSSNGDLYIQSVSTDTVTPALHTSKVKMSGVKEIYGSRTNGTALLLGNSGQLSYYTVNGDNKEISFYKDGSQINTFVLDVLYSDSADICYIKTTDGIFKYNYGYTNANYIELPFNPVDYIGIDSSNSALFLADDGYAWRIGNNVYNAFGEGDTPDPNEFIRYRLDWMNDNPIVEDRILANISFEHNSILDRRDTIISFSLVANNNPSAFNIYYAKSDDVGNKEKWKVIEHNISSDSLNPTLYETPYKDNNGNSIDGLTYEYTWEINNEDLTNIQLIVEPVY